MTVELPDVAMLPTSACVITGASNVNTADCVPTTLATAAPTARALPVPCGVVQVSDVEDSHFETQETPSITTVGFVVACRASPRSAKLKPNIVTTVPDLVGPLLMNDWETVGAS